MAGNRRPYALLEPLRIFRHYQFFCTDHTAGTTRYAKCYTCRVENYTRHFQKLNRRILALAKRA